MEFEPKEVLIHSQKIMEILSCPICSEIMKNSSIIGCGHSFCEACILQWINLNNNCPLCKVSVKKEDVFKNYTLDEIKNEVLNERNLREEENIKGKYLDYCKEKSDSISQLHDIFFFSLKNMFNNYENFFFKLDKDTEDLIQKISNSNGYGSVDNGNQPKLNTEFVNVLDDNDKVDYDLKNDQKLRNVMDNKKRIQDKVFTILKSQLALLPEDPRNLPIFTKIIILHTNHIIPNVHIQRFKNISHLLNVVEEFFKTLGDPVTDLSKAQFYYKRLSFESDINQNLIENQGRTYLKNMNDIFLNVDILPGESIYLEGEIILKSNQPKNCISYNYSESLVVDYFHCDTCSKSWICQECSKACHNNHQISLFKKGHTTTWACCYCYKISPNVCCLKNKTHN